MGNYDGSVKIDSKLDLNGLKKAVGELKQVISDAVSGIQAEAGGNRRSGEERGAGGCQRREGGKGRLCRSRAGRRAGRPEGAYRRLGVQHGRGTGSSFRLLEGQLAQTNEKIEAQRAVVKQLEKELRVAKFSDIGVENAEKKLDAANRTLEGLYQAAGNCYEEIDRLHEQLGDAADAADTMADSTDQAAEKTGKLADAAAESAEKVGKTGDALDPDGRKIREGRRRRRGRGQEGEEVRGRREERFGRLQYEDCCARQSHRPRH